MDNLDLRILMLLQENSRESLGNIAEKLGVSKATVSRRLAMMETKGYVSRYTLILDHSKMGVMRGFISLQVAATSINLVIEELRKYPEIESVMRVFGDHALICEVCTINVDALYDLIQGRIMKIPNVHNVEVDILIDRTPMNINAPMDIMRSKLDMT